MTKFRAFFATRHRGQTIVLFALMSLVLMAGLGLVIDAGVNYAQRRNMQNVADTAALAGTRVIARQPSLSAYSAPPNIPSTMANRQAVWDAIFETAVRNGAPNDARRFECEYVGNNRNMIGTSCKVADAVEGALLIPPTASGVRVRVSEEHTTFFMRAIGIQTSGTAAIATAQIHVVQEMAHNDVLFMVCGINARKTDGGFAHILEWELQTDYISPDPSPLPRSPKPTATYYTKILDSAYKYDWNQRDNTTGKPTVLAADRPTFVIKGANIAKCDSTDSSWNGLLKPVLKGSALDEKEVIQMPERGENRRPPFLWGQATDSNPGERPMHSINGTQGCQGPKLSPVTAAPDPDGCIMLLPITNNYVIDARDHLEGRVWGVFWVTKWGNDYHGALIKNYPLHTDGLNIWSPTYQGPVTVTLVKST
jgi:hypothetical protein